MAIIIRETKELPNREEVTVKKYISDISPLTGDLRKKAEEYDRLIGKKVSEIEQELEEMNLLSLRGRPKVLKMWYEFGKRLRFVDDLELSPTARKFVWRAIYDHTKRIYDSSAEMPVRLLRSPPTSDISYAYIIGTMDWEFVCKAGNWTAWVEFLDSEVMRTDTRIIAWIKQLQTKAPLQGGFLRVLNRAIRRQLAGIETLRIDDDKLIERLEEILQTALLEKTGPS